MAEMEEGSWRERELAERWCASKGAGWSVIGSPLGKGGTAPVFEIASPEGLRALKVHDWKLSNGERARVEEKRIVQQVALRGHDCPYLVQVYEGGRFEDRLVLLMNRAPGQELEKRLPAIPRTKIRQIVDQVARAAIFLRDHGLCHRDIKAANVFISDDYERCTLLDISVVRNVSDPIGLGTDHEGQLPVVATARYAPPEYLFRLLDPGADLWHAVNVYQLGALLHDLIMREPLFEKEYRNSAQNRYRFAWIVATSNPPVFAEDVDRDLVLTAQRALDKDWGRRSALRLEDFLSDANVQQERALNVLGLGVAQSVASVDADPSARIQRVHEVSRVMEQAIVLYFREKGVTVKHESAHGPNDVSRYLRFLWTIGSRGGASEDQQADLKVTLMLVSGLGEPSFSTSLELSVGDLGDNRREAMAIPDVLDHQGVDSILTRQVTSGFEQLAIRITRAAARNKE